jgi:hypothetical protein
VNVRPPNAAWFGWVGHRLREGCAIRESGARHIGASDAPSPCRGPCRKIQLGRSPACRQPSVPDSASPAGWSSGEEQGERFENQSARWGNGSGKSQFPASKASASPWGAETRCTPPTLYTFIRRVPYTVSRAFDEDVLAFFALGFGPVPTSYIWRYSGTMCRPRDDVIPDAGAIRPTPLHSEEGSSKPGRCGVDNYDGWDKVIALQAVR